MDIRACPGCGDEITPAYSEKQVHLYCQSCGYEAQEESHRGPEASPGERQKLWDSKVVSIKSRHKKQERRDVGDRVKRRTR